MDSPTQEPGSLDELVVVLGHRLLPDNSPSDIYISRLDKGAEVLEEKRRNGSKAKLVLSGGKPHGHERSEAQVGLDYLKTSYSLGEDDVLLEEKANDSSTNALYVRMLAEAVGADELTIVTSDYHVPRVAYVFSWVAADLNTSFVGAASGFSEEERKKHVEGESRKMDETVEFFSSLGAAPGDYRKILKALEARGGYLTKDNVV